MTPLVETKKILTFRSSFRRNPQSSHTGCGEGEEEAIEQMEREAITQPRSTEIVRAPTQSSSSVGCFRRVRVKSIGLGQMFVRTNRSPSLASKKVGREKKKSDMIDNAALQGVSNRLQALVRTEEEGHWPLLTKASARTKVTQPRGKTPRRRATREELSSLSRCR